MALGNLERVESARTPAGDAPDLVLGRGAEDDKVVRHGVEDSMDEEQARLEGFYSKWSESLGLDQWDVTRHYFDGEFVQGDGAPSVAAAASTHVQWEYRHASISFNMRLTTPLTDERAEALVLHEAMHVLLNEMREDGMKHEERVATTLSWAFMRTEQAQEDARE